jgi:hypothetical protein
VSDVDGRTVAKDFRYDLGSDLLIDMKKGEDLPLPSRRRVAKVMMEYYKRDGHDDDLKASGYRWRPCEDYWCSHLPDVCGRLRERGLFFEYTHFENSIEGAWRFCSKKEYESALKRQYSEITTRADTYNGKLEDAEKKWDLELPHANLAALPVSSK